MSAEALLPIALSAAVPLHIAELKRLPWSVIKQIAQASGQHVAEKGDVILFRSKKKGQTADAFNALARGIACLAFVPGGVRIFGLHFEDVHPETLNAEDIREICASLARGISSSELAREFQLDEHVIKLVGEAPL